MSAEIVHLINKDPQRLLRLPKRQLRQMRLFAAGLVDHLGGPIEVEKGKVVDICGRGDETPPAA